MGAGNLSATSYARKTYSNAQTGQAGALTSLSSEAVSHDTAFAFDQVRKSKQVF